MAFSVIALPDKSDSTSLISGGLPGSRGKPLRLFNELIKFEEGRIRPKTDLKLQFSEHIGFKTTAWRVTITDADGVEFTTLSPIGVLPSGIMYTGRGNLDVPMKSNKPTNHSEASWWLEFSPFAYASAVADESGRNKHYLAFLKWAEQVSKWMFYEALVHPKFEAQWKKRVLESVDPSWRPKPSKKGEIDPKLASIYAKMETWGPDDLDRHYRADCRCFVPQSSESDVERIIFTAPCMARRKDRSGPIPFETGKPLEIVQLENKFLDKETKMPEFYYNRIPIYRQSKVGAWDPLSWTERDRIPDGLAHACELRVFLTDSGKGHAKMHFDLARIFLVGVAPKVPPRMFGASQPFKMEINDADLVRALVEAEEEMKNKAMQQVVEVEDVEPLELPPSKMEEPSRKRKMDEKETTSKRDRTMEGFVIPPAEEE